MIVADAVKLTQSELSDSQSVNRTTLFSHSLRRTITRITDTMTVNLNVLLQSLASIPQIYQSIFQINRPERKTVYSKLCHVLRGEKCPDASRMFALKYRVRHDLNTDVSVFDPTRDTLASRCSKRTARKLPRCGTGARAKSTYCDLSSFGPVKDKMYWPGA